MVGDFHDLIHENLLRSKRDVEQHEVGPCDVAVVQERALQRIADGLLRATLSRSASRSHDGPSAVAHDGVDVVHVHVDFPGQRDDFRNAFGGGAEDLVCIGEGAADGLVAKQLTQLVVADDEQGVHCGAHGFQTFSGLRVSAAALKLEGHRHNADGQDAAFLAGLGNDGRCACPGAATHAGGYKDHAGVCPQQCGELVQAFNGGVLADLWKRARTLPSCEGGPQLNFAGDWADVKGLRIGVADDEVDTCDALLKHRVDGIGTATADADDLDGRIGGLGNVELHGEVVCGWKGGVRRGLRFRTSSSRFA